MATLYNRAGPSQRRILRIVEGAVKNACDAHGFRGAPHNFARSVAKRAAGTLSAQWPEVLAAEMPSDRAKAENLRPASPSFANPAKRAKRGAAQLSSRTPPSTFKKLYTRLGIMAGMARKSGNQERADAIADALRVVAAADPARPAND